MVTLPRVQHIIPAFPWHDLHDTLLIRFKLIFVFLMFTAESLSCFTQNLNTIGFPCTIQTNGISSNRTQITIPYEKSRTSRHQLSPNRSKRPSEQRKYEMMYQRTLTNARNTVVMLFVLLEVRVSSLSKRFRHLSSFTSSPASALR